MEFRIGHLGILPNIEDDDSLDGIARVDLCEEFIAICVIGEGRLQGSGVLRSSLIEDVLVVGRKELNLSPNVLNANSYQANLPLSLFLEHVLTDGLEAALETVDGEFETTVSGR